MGAWNIVYKRLLALFILINLCTNIATCSRPLVVHQEGEDLVDFACNHTLYYEICVTSLRSDPRSKTSDLKGLAVIALDLSITQGMQMLAHFHDMKSGAGSYNSSDYASETVEDCIDEYSNAMVNLKEAINSLHEGSYGTVNELVSGAMTDCQTCEDEIEDKSTSISQLADGNQYYYRLCSNLLAMTTLLS
ncbi:hypothetical protein Ancab_017889 [Ancistrocladus abbreviatus]